MRHLEFDEQGIGLDMRCCVLGVEIRNREETGEGMGGYLYQPGTIGDIIGGQLWPVDAHATDSRDIPAWRFSWPSQVSERSLGTAMPSKYLPLKTLSTIQEQADREQAEGQLKSSTEAWVRDTRFPSKARQFDDRIWFSDSPHDKNELILSPEKQAARLWQRFPVGYTGLTMGLNREDREETVFLPTDARLVSDWDSLFGDFGTFVCDLGEVEGGVGLETKRRAPLQALCRVVPGNFGGPCDGEIPTNSDVATKWGTLALNIGKTPQVNSTWGGVFWDHPCGGHVSAKSQAGESAADPRTGPGGPLDVGGTKAAGDGADKHFLITDGDGKAINSMHISLDAFYCRSGDEGDAPEFDAPLKHDGEKKEYPKHADVWREVKFVYDAGLTHPHPCLDEELEGRHIWLAGCVSEYGQHTPPQGSEAGGAAINPDPPKQAGGNGDGGGAGVSPRYLSGPAVSRAEGSPRTLSDTTAFREYNQIYSEVALPGLLARPQFQSSTAVDFLNWAGPEVNQGIDPEPYRIAFRRDAPLVGRLEAFGKQTSSQWAYTESPSTGGRYAPTGTADGGWVFTPPESSLLQVQGNAQPATVSNPYFIFAPNTRLGFGRPDTDSGQMKSGYSLEVGSATGNTIKGYQENGSTRTQVMELSDDIRLTTAGKGLILKSPSGYYSYRISVNDSGKVVTASA